MIDESTARRLVAERASPLPAIECDLHDALGLVLAADVVSDIDSPPYDKALVDGYAVCSRDFSNADPATVTTLRILEEVTAGVNPTRQLTPGAATRIMTGAPLPSNADAVIMVEQSQLDGEHVRLAGQAQPEQHVLRAGAAMKRGDVAARLGACVRSIEIGVLAEVGCSRPLVTPAPRVAVISTGDELVDLSRSPDQGQIRNSNGPMLAAQAIEAGAKVTPLGIVGDDVPSLEARIREGLKCDLLVLSGGVSAGVLDLVPPALERCGVEKIFHKVALKPGKPVWFGQHENGALVFGLPGNPVGSLVCFERLVKPAIQALAGRSDPFLEPHVFWATLTKAFEHRGVRPTYRPAFYKMPTESPAGRPEVSAIDWQGSADLSALAGANCLIAFAAGDQRYESGELVACHPLGYSAK